MNTLDPHTYEQYVGRPRAMDKILPFLCQEEKGCSPLKPTFSAHCFFWSMESYCFKLYGPFSYHELRKLIHSYYQ